MIPCYAPTLLQCTKTDDEPGCCGQLCTLAQRLALALGPEHLLLRFRTYDEYPTEKQARWRI
jgi:hypothetical protein